MSNLGTLMSLILPVLVLAACGGVGGSEPASEPLTPKESEAVRNSSTDALRQDRAAAVIDASNRLGFKLLALSAQGGGNTLVSPISISMALSMTYNGAAGETKNQMSKALQLGTTPIETLNSTNREVRLLANNLDPKVELAVANSLWVRLGLEFDSQFLKRNEEFFAADVTSLDFDNPRAVDTINGWVSQKTKGKIPTILDRIAPNAGLYLINAVYFKGLWAEPFSKDRTKDGPFNLSDGKQIQVPMMNLRSDFDYFESDSIQAIRLPYGSKRLGMFVVLPKAGGSLLEVAEDCATPKWSQMISEMRSREGDVSLPRFTFAFETSLKSSLAQLGMVDAFEPNRANFTGMRTAGDLFIQEVKHKTWIQVDEEGTEAAAATGVEVGVTAIPQTFEFIANRPFLFVISDQPTGQVLFAGIVVDPRG